MDDTEFGLGAAVFTADRERAQRLLGAARRRECLLEHGRPFVRAAAVVRPPALRSRHVDVGVGRARVRTREGLAPDPVSRSLRLDDGDGLVRRDRHRRGVGGDHRARDRWPGRRRGVFGRGRASAGAGCRGRGFGGRRSHRCRRGFGGRRRDRRSGAAAGAAASVFETMVVSGAPKRSNGRSPVRSARPDDSTASRDRRAGCRRRPLRRR